MMHDMKVENLNFKRGNKYTRKDIGYVCYPGVGRPAGGMWDTGYVHVENNLIIFMNIGLAGRTGHDFENYFDEEKNTIIWFGKPNSHSKQNTFKKLLEGVTTPYFFARWDKNPQFTFLGTGSILNYVDGAKTLHGSSIKLTVRCDDAKEVIKYSTIENDLSEIENSQILQPSSFVMEKHLEDFLVKNWSLTEFEKDYKFVKNQYPTDTGPLDILAQKKDKSEFLVIELKRDKASDEVIGQTLRYMGFINKHVAKNGENVRGIIIANEEDQGLRNALSMTKNIEFFKYKINFSLGKIEL